MKKILDCTNIQTTYRSIQSILGVNLSEIINFVIENKCLFSIDSKYGYPSFERPDIKLIKEFFNINSFNYNYIIVHHASAILEDDSYLDKGIFNLKGLAETSDNSFKKFLSDFKIRYEINSNGTPFFEYQGNKISSDYLERRFSADKCINGFLYSYSILEDTNINQLKLCPEIVAHLGRQIGIDLRSEWIKRSVPSSVSFKVELEQLHSTTFPYAGQNMDYQAKQEYFIKSAIDYLLIEYAIMYQYPKDNPMIFLNEDVQVCKEDIISVIPLTKISDI